MHIVSAAIKGLLAQELNGGLQQVLERLIFHGLYFCDNSWIQNLLLLVSMKVCVWQLFFFDLQQTINLH